MLDKNELCKKISEIFPDIGTCGINVTVNYDDEKKAWVVDLKKDTHELKTFLELDEADACMEGSRSRFDIIH